MPIINRINNYSRAVEIAQDGEEDHILLTFINSMVQHYKVGYCSAVPNDILSDYDDISIKIYEFHK